MEDGVAFLATRAPTQANPVHHTLGQSTERGVGPPVLVNGPDQRAKNDHFLTTKHTRECSLTQIRTLDLAFSVKESNKYWYLQAIEVSAAKERGEGWRGQEPRYDNGMGAGGKRCAQKNRETGLQSVKNTSGVTTNHHQVEENPRPYCLERVGAAHNLELAVLHTACTFSPYLYHNTSTHAHTFSIHTIAVYHSRPQNTTAVACRVSCCRCRYVLHETHGERRGKWLVAKREIDREARPCGATPLFLFGGTNYTPSTSPLSSRLFCFALCSLA